MYSFIRKFLPVTRNILLKNKEPTKLLIVRAMGSTNIHGLDVYTEENKPVIDR
jgi:hypothetical protein